MEFNNMESLTNNHLVNLTSVTKKKLVQPWVRLFVINL